MKHRSLMGTINRDDFVSLVQRAITKPLKSRVDLLTPHPCGRYSSIRPRQTNSSAGAPRPGSESQPPLGHCPTSRCSADGFCVQKWHVTHDFGAPKKRISASIGSIRTTTYVSSYLEYFPADVTFPQQAPRGKPTSSKGVDNLDVEIRVLGLRATKARAVPDHAAVNALAFAADCPAPRLTFAPRCRNRLRASRP